MFLQLRAQRPVTPKRSLSASEAPLTQHLSDATARKCLLRREDRLFAGMGAPWGPRRTDGVGWTAPGFQMYQEN